MYELIYKFIYIRNNYKYKYPLSMVVWLWWERVMYTYLSLDLMITQTGNTVKVYLSTDSTYDTIPYLLHLQ